MHRHYGELLSRDSSQLLLIDHQLTSAVAVRSMDPQRLRSNTIALARAAVSFAVPVTLTIAVKDAQQAAAPYQELAEVLIGHRIVSRETRDVWDDEGVMGSLALNARRQLVIAGLWTESAVCSSAISAMTGANYSVFVVSDASGGMTTESHALACRRMSLAGARIVTLPQVTSEWQRQPLPYKARQPGSAGLA
ncbi:MAG: isochorismatase family protein [Woeseiaceae bacterium]|nr:isochorismatase family protein [Woeseiaceae bacterium]